MNKIFSIILLVLQSGCSGIQRSPTSTASHLPTSASTSTSTVVPSTATFISTVTVAPLSTWTPLPTLTNENSFLDFISFTKNSICTFPCWAGIVLGKTTWDEAIFALRPMEAVATLEILPNEESRYGRVNTIDWYLYGGDFRAEGKFLTGDKVNLIRMSLESFSDNIPSYSLPLPERFNMQSALIEYGAPSMVFIYTFIHDEQGPLPFSILLVYPENNFFIIYKRDAKLSGNTVAACDSDYYLELAVVDSVDKLISTDAIANTPETESIGIENWKPVEQVLNISPEKFHEIYSSSSSECIIFPVSLWQQ